MSLYAKLIPSIGGGGPDTTSIARNGSRPPTADQPWGNHALTGFSSLQSNTTPTASYGALMLGNSDVIAWRDYYNTVDIAMSINHNNINISSGLEVNGVNGISINYAGASLNLTNNAPVSWTNAANTGVNQLTSNTSDILVYNGVPVNTPTFPLIGPAGTYSAPTYQFTGGSGMYLNGGPALAVGGSDALVCQTVGGGLNTVCIAANTSLVLGGTSKTSNAYIVGGARPVMQLPGSNSNYLTIQDSAAPSATIGAGAMVANQAFAVGRVAVIDAPHNSTGRETIIAYTSLTAARVVTLIGTNQASWGDGQMVIIKDESGSCSPTNTITVQVASGGLIDGAATVVLSSAYASLRLYIGNNQYHQF